ncbi:MAG: transporter [Gammaproteobacteria bacterium]|jgi:ABC-2 type transport system ATP-binding protein|nr:transporter [Gammaproteobacteria bacterium]
MNELALDIKSLTKVYKNGFTALKGIDLAVKQGDFFALLGPNGAGKSTAIGIITSLVNKTAGEVRILNTDLHANPAKAKAYLGVVPQEVNLNIFETPWQILVNQAGYYGVPRTLAKQRAEQYLKQMELWSKKDVQARMLSGGMKRRLMIARALMHEPKILILDEPTAGVDVEIRQSMWGFLADLNRKGVTIVLTTHYLEEAESLCNQVAIINKGEIIENTSMKALLLQLESETLVLYPKETVKEAPELGQFPCQWIDERTLEVDIKKGQSLTELISALQHQGIEIASMRNKSNRLEKLFIDMVRRGQS